VSRKARTSRWLNRLCPAQSLVALSRPRFSSTRTEQGLMPRMSAASLDRRFLSLVSAIASMKYWIADFAIQENQFPPGLADFFHYSIVTVKQEFDMSPAQRILIQKLNILLAIPRQKMSSADWNRLRKNLVYALYNRKKMTSAYKAILRSEEEIYAAQDTLQAALGDLRMLGRTVMSLNEHNVHLFAAPGRPMFSLTEATDCQTAICRRFVDLAVEAGISQEEILTCANHRCQKTFIPLRKPVKGKRAFCSPECARRVAVWDYRRREADKLKAKERMRGRQRYKKKLGLL